ncbi:MAG: N-acetylmuramoyl-L-alanine amidase [Lachnospiraceae bacterium]|nr:N-acetylmuramoyl-L-alanine amidase [Lachnospiraceae bacterium]
MSKYKAYIAPSTQQHNITALGNTEENVMHDIANELNPLLIDSGIETIVGRKEQTLAEMVKESNTNKVDIYVSIHSNASSTVGDTPRGCEVFHYTTSKNGKRLAECVYKYLEILTPTDDRDVKTTTTLYEVAKTNATAILIEVDFHDSFEGAKWIEDNKRLIAEAIAQGICDYFNIPLKKNPYKEAILKIKEIIKCL